MSECRVQEDDRRSSPVRRLVGAGFAVAHFRAFHLQSRRIYVSEPDHGPPEPFTTATSAT